MEEIYNEILDETSDYHCEYGKHLSNHLPMALQALYRIGGDYDRLMDFRNSYEMRLEPKRTPRMTISASNWKKYLGDYNKYEEYLHYFDQEFNNLGSQRLVDYYLPELINGLGTAAFHAIIRLAYAIEAQNSSEIVASLAYLANSYLDLTQPQTHHEDSVAIGVNEYFERLQNQSYFKSHSIPGYTIFERMRNIAHSKQYLQFIEKYTPDQLSLDTLATYANQIYNSTMDFTALHMVTGTHALRVINDFSSVDSDALISSYWTAFVPAYITINVPEFDPYPSTDEFSQYSWKDILWKAQQSDDAHDIKIVFSAHEEGKVYGSELYRIAAAKSLELDP